MSDQEGEPGQEGSVGTEADPVGSNLSTKRQKSLLRALQLADARVKAPDFDPDLAKSLHKLSDFTPSPSRYARQQRITLTIRRAGKPEVKKTLSGYLIVEHRDQYDAYAGTKRILVESDKTSLIIIGHTIDQKNIIGRNMRKAKSEPITSLADTLGDVLGLEVLLELPDKT